MRDAQTRLIDLFGDRFDQDVIEVHEATFTWDQLHDWHIGLLGLLRLPGVVFTDVDETANRIVVGVEEHLLKTLDSRLGEVLRDFDVPLGAVTLEAASPVKLLTRQNRRPLVGGLQIQYEVDASTWGTCSLGFPAQRFGVDGFITAAHCSTQFGQVDGQRYWQPNRTWHDWLTGANRVGIETADPYFEPNLPGCGPGTWCRYSDANFVRLDNVTAHRGLIAAWADPNNANWDGSSIWRVVANQLPMIDQVVHRTGQATGQRHGQITNTCANIDIGQDRMLLCQALAFLFSDEGDSGGPVYRRPDAPFSDPNVWAVGTATGRFVEDPMTLIISPIDLIKNELTGNQPGHLRVCAPAWNC